MHVSNRLLTDLFSKNEGLTASRNSLDLFDNSYVNELAQVHRTEIVNQCQIDAAKVQRRKVEAVEYTSLSNDQKGMKLLKAKDRLEIECASGEQGLELDHIKVVVDAEVLEQSQVELVDSHQIVEVCLFHDKLVKLVSVDGSALFSSRHGTSNGSEAGKDAELHVAGWVLEIETNSEVW